VIFQCVLCSFFPSNLPNPIKKLHKIAPIAALRLPYGLPFGSEHFVVVERRKQPGSNLPPLTGLTARLGVAAGRGKPRPYQQPNGRQAQTAGHKAQKANSRPKANSPFRGLGGQRGTKRNLAALHSAARLADD